MTKEFMDFFIASEHDLVTHTQPLQEGVYVIHFKMVGVGPKTLEEVKYNGKDIHSVASKQTGHFIIGTDKQQMKEAMHNLVDRFFEKQNEK
jgi:hypothetical protein